MCHHFICLLLNLHYFYSIPPSYLRNVLRNSFLLFLLLFSSPNHQYPSSVPFPLFPPLFLILLLIILLSCFLFWLLLFSFSCAFFCPSSSYFSSFLLLLHALLPIVPSLLLFFLFTPFLLSLFLVLSRFLSSSSFFPSLLPFPASIQFPFSCSSLLLLFS